jgi:hypothetical protein
MPAHVHWFLRERRRRQRLLGLLGEEPDPNFANVVFLAGFDGTNGATSYTEESASARASSSFGTGAQISTTRAKFGASSLSVNGSEGAKASWADQIDWQLAAANADPFTVEAWIYREGAQASARTVVGQYLSFGNFAWRIYINANHTLSFVGDRTGSASQWTVTSTGTVPQDAWTHIAADKDADGVVRLFADGAMIGKATPTNPTIHNAAAPLDIGGVFTNAITGYVDELRITKGVNRYGSDASFAPPAVAFPRS